MTANTLSVTVHDMSIADPIQLLVLEEFRLRVADVDGAAARVVAGWAHGTEPAIPLLTSISDRRDVATLRAVHAGKPTERDAAEHAALDPFVASRSEPRHYTPKLSERSQTPPSHFRLAVTESGINTQDPTVTPGQRSAGAETTSSAVGLIWIGAPVGTHAGLLVLLGSYDDPQAVGRHASDWPLPLSRDLGVRVYENSGGAHDYRTDH